MTNNSEIQEAARRQLKDYIELIKSQLPLTELCEFPKIDIGIGSRPPELAIAKLQQLYSDANLNALNRVKEGASPEYVRFSQAFPTSILVREIDSFIAEQDRPRWREYLQPYWIETAKDGYKLLHDQVDDLVAGLVKVATSSNSKSRRKCVVIPILPIGNCLDVAVLRQLYTSQGWHVTTPLWNLPRNAARRNASIQRLLSESGVGSDVLVHYVDEWISGTNFSGIVEGILKAKWPSAQLNLTAICSKENAGLKNIGEFITALRSIGCSNPFDAAIIQIPKCVFSPIDQGGKRLFSQDFGRLVAWRKVSSAM